MHLLRTFRWLAIAAMAGSSGPTAATDLAEFQKSIAFFESSKLEHPRSALGKDGAPGDGFGWSVSISGDVAVVGARSDAIQSLASAGSAYVFRRIGSTWQPEAKLGAFDAQPGQRFGWSVAIHGNVVLVGAPHEGSPFSPARGAVYVFTRNGAEWVVSQKLFASTFPSGSDGAGGEFGSSIAFDGVNAVVGAELDSFYGAPQGAAFVFRYSGNQFNWDERLDNPAGDDADRFGASVAISGTSILVGAPAADPSGVATGSAHVFAFDGIDWNLEANLVAPDGAAGDAFGTSVAITGDSALIGASGDDVSGAINRGSARFFRRSNGLWSQAKVLAADDGMAGDGFGTSVALELDVAVIGAPNHPASGVTKTGALYVFRDDGLDWIQEDELKDVEGEDSDYFGGAVSMEGDSVISGAFSDDVESHSSQGSARIFEFAAGNWMTNPKLSGGTGAPQAHFGQSVSLSGNTALVTAPQDEGQSERAVYVLDRLAEGWQVVERWTPDPSDPAGFFGYDLSIDGELAVVGDCGSERATVYERQAGTWTLATVLQPEDGVDGDRFGCAVAASGNRIVIGAFEAPHAGFGDQGAVYVFVRDSGIWSFETKLVDEDLAYEFFGEDVAIFGDTILVGAQGEREGPGAEQTGAVHVFERNANVWSKVVKLVAPDAESNKGFGDSVAIFEDFALIGAPGDGWSFGQRRGAAYMFHRGQLGWKLTAKFSASDGGINDWFGETVALDADLAVVGAPGHDLPGRADSGSAYLFARSAKNWSELGKLLPSDAAADAAYGSSASIFGGVVAVGSPEDDGSTIHGNAGQGAVYLTDFAIPPEGSAVFRDGFEP